MATNRQHAHLEQVQKDSEYNLTESASDLFCDGYEFQICDLGDLSGTSSDRRRFVDQLGMALVDVGFVILVNHGIDPSLFEKTHEATVELFTKTTDSRKFEFVEGERKGSVRLGYFPFQKSTVLQPDFVEGWEFDRTAFPQVGDVVDDSNSYWPDQRFKNTFYRQWQVSAELVLPLMHAMLDYLGCEPDLLDDELASPKTVLRLNYFPPLPKETVNGSGRLVAHEDITLFTLLPASSIEGLQVYHPRLESWARLNAPPGSIILNSGDYLKRISNNIYQSCTHRVATPRDPHLRQVPRTSFPFFVYLHEDTILEVLPGLGTPRYEPIRAFDFHTQITRKFYGDLNE